MDTQKTSIDRSKPFGWADRFGYALGDVGNNFSFAVVNTFLMIFYTNVLGLSGVTVGLLFLIARFIDAIADITVGRLVDSSKLHKRGRFIPWIARFKYPLLIATILVFVPFVKEWAFPFKITYVFVTYLLWGIFYSTVNIPYGSMASALSDSPNDKTSLSTWRSLGSATGSAIVSFVVPIFMYVGASQKIDGVRFWIVASVMALLGFGCYILTSKLPTERVRTQRSESVPLGTVLKDMFTDRALVILVVLDIILVINQNLSGTNISYLFNDYFKNSSAMSIALIFNFATVLLLAPFAQYFTKKFGRKEVTTVSLFFASIVYGILVFIHTSSATVYLVFLFFGSLGAAMFNLMVWAFITDVIDNQQVTTGIREDGTIYGVNSFARKVAQALGGSFGAFMLTMIGYVSSTSGGAEQSQQVIDRIYYLASGIPAVCCGLAALVMLFFYPLNKKRVESNAAILREKNAKN